MDLGRRPCQMAWMTLSLTGGMMRWRISDDSPESTAAVVAVLPRGALGALVPFFVCGFLAVASRDNL